MAKKTGDMGLLLFEVVEHGERARYDVSGARQVFIAGRSQRGRPERSSSTAGEPPARGMTPPSFQLRGSTQ